MNLRPLSWGLFCAAIVVVSPHAVAEWKLNPPGYHGGPNGLTADLAGYAQCDLRLFANWDAQAAQVKSLEIRRARAGVEGSWGRRVVFESDLDLVDPEERLRNAWVQVRIANALAVRAGYYKLPMSPEYLTGYPAVDLVERSRLATVLVPGRDVGIMAHGFSPRLNYQVGLFAGDTLKNIQRAEVTGAGRVVLKPASGLELGGSLTRGQVRADRDRTGEPVASPLRKGVAARNPANYVYYERHFVRGARTRGGLEAAYFHGRDSVKAEAIRMWEQRKHQACAEPLPACADLPSQVGTGWALSATRLLTGEKKTRTMMNPTRPAHTGGPGAIEVALRLEGIRFDDTGSQSAPEERGPRAANIPRAGELILAGGLSWWPSRWFRLETNLFLERYRDPATAPEAGRKGNYVTFVTRLELHVP